jgi:hypothetical protein
VKPEDVKVGTVVCDCRFKHLKVVEILNEYHVRLEDETVCAIEYCLDPVDHSMEDHPEGYR